jgi:hypothetical protein
VTVLIKLGQIKKGSPLDNKEYGFRTLISRGLGGLRWVKTAERKLYYDDRWNGTPIFTLLSGSVTTKGLNTQARNY